MRFLRWLFKPRRKKKLPTATDDQVRERMASAIAAHPPHLFHDDWAKIDWQNEVMQDFMRDVPFSLTKKQLVKAHKMIREASNHPNPWDLR